MNIQEENSARYFRVQSDSEEPSDSVSLGSKLYGAGIEVDSSESLAWVLLPDGSLSVSEADIISQTKKPQLWNTGGKGSSVPESTTSSNKLRPQLRVV